MRVELVNQIGPYLTRASRAEQLCALILQAWRQGPVALDFAGVKQISPSFANALFFNLLHQKPLREVQRLVSVENAELFVTEVIQTAIDRKTSDRAALTAYVSASDLTPA